MQTGTGIEAKEKVPAPTQVETPTPIPIPAKKKKLAKDLSTKPGTVLITVQDGEKGTMEFPFNSLPKAIQEKFGAFGYGHKLGDSAAGRKGKDAEAAILKVNEGLMKGDWSVRAPAAPKLNVAELVTNFGKLSKKEQEVAKKFLSGIGLSIPGVTA